MVIVEMFLKKTCCNEKFVAFFFTEHLDNDDHYKLQQSQLTDFAHHIGAVIRCGRVMADNIAYAKFRKTLLI